MLGADHLNIDGPPFPIKCVRKFGSALGGEVTYRDVCGCVCVFNSFFLKKIIPKFLILLNYPKIFNFVKLFQNFNFPYSFFQIYPNFPKFICS